MLSDQQFERAQRLALALAGIELVERHRELLERRSRRIGIGDSTGIESLLCNAEAGDALAAQQLVCLLTTKFTGFVRHPCHFDIAAKHAKRAVDERGAARLWSAAAATGEEPWSLAMAVLEVFQGHQPSVSILATDVDVGALAIAERGEYSEAALRSLSPDRRARFFNLNRPTQLWSVAPAVRRLLEFYPLNLTSVEWPDAGPFDVIFCRNVLMYLEASRRYAVLERMAALLAPDGWLMLDPTEHLGSAGHWFTSSTDGVYSRRHALPASRRVPGRISIHSPKPQL